MPVLTRTFRSSAGPADPSAINDARNATTKTRILRPLLQLFLFMASSPMDSCPSNVQYGRQENLLAIFLLDAATTTSGLSRPNCFDLNIDSLITNHESARDRLVFGGRDFQSV